MKSKFLVVAIVVLAVIAWMGLASIGVAGSAGATTAGHSSAGAASELKRIAASAGTTARPTPASAITKASPAVSSSSVVGRSGAAARPAPLSAQVDPTAHSVTHPAATPAEVQRAKTQGYVSPLYTSDPAPIGLAEYGLAQNSTGGVSPFYLNTTSLQATFDTPSIDFPNATDLEDSSPDGYDVQLNSVVTNVTLFGNDTYQFWTQNCIYYFPYSGVFYFIESISNFSSPTSVLPASTFYAHGLFGIQVPNYDYTYFGPYQVSSPYNATFTMVSNITDGRDALYWSLNVTQTNPAKDINESNFDYVIFNSLNTTTPPLTVPANFTADGYNYDPFGLTNDFELVICGPSGGSQTTLLTADANLTLDYWNATTSSYQAVPSAFSYGSETGESASGGAMSWTTGSDGQPVGLMTTGPTLLGGLWNASSPAGGPGMIDLNIQPGNAFVLVSYAGSSVTPFNISQPELAITIYTSELTLPAGTYNITVELADYNPMAFDLFVVGQTNTYLLTADLAFNDSQGVYTPLWAWSNTQIAAISTSGSGTILSPYIVVNNQVAELSTVFGALNVFGFPVFPGVYFLGTTAYTEFSSPPSFAVSDLASSPFAAPLPSTDNLPYWFYDDSNISLVNAADITGWFSAAEFDYPFFLADNVVFWNCTNLLIANDTFETEAQALLLYNGVSATNPGAVGNSTVWGNTFLEVSPPSPSANLVPSADGLGLDEQENGDLIYNNYFATPTTAVSYPQDLYTGLTVVYVNTWNIGPEPSSIVNYDANWPAFALTGSIIGGTTQGGNYWWDYGLTTSGASFLGLYPNSNPFNVLPYTESGWIDDFGTLVSGDYDPLLYSALFSISLNSTNLPAGATWGYSVTNVTYPGEVYYSGATTTLNVSFVLPDGLYAFAVTPPAGYAATPSSGDLLVSGFGFSVDVMYSPADAGTAVAALESVYNARPDLELAFPDAWGNASNFSLLVNWAGGVVTGKWLDSANATLSPFGYYYDLMMVYDGRSDLQAAFPGAYTNATNYTLLLNWAGWVVINAWVDAAYSTLSPFGFYYDLAMVYDGRSDLQAAFPDAFSNFANYTLLVNWAGWVVTGAWVDTAYSTLLPYGYYYTLMLVYDGRSDLQAAFPNAFTNSVSYEGLLVWAKGVVLEVFPDTAYSTLLPFAANYEALG